IREALHISFPVVPEPFEAAMIELKEFPAALEVRELWRSFLLPWTSRLVSEHILQPAAWIQTANLHEGDTADVVRRHGASWLPEVGLGVWPDREPPRLWTAEDFQALEPGQKPPPLMNTVFFVSGGESATEDALAILAGSGTLVYALLPGSPQAFHEKMTALFLPVIREEALRGYSFYVPLLDTQSLKSADVSESGNVESPLHLWLGDSMLFLQENKSEGSVLVVSRLPGAVAALQEWIAR
ncbi:MAG TPA: hypothetical protein VHT24_16870, partial [Pseudacidobacterium sp.]|nr:hypothetical protein [Pseudacidobacterium sp.]